MHDEHNDGPVIGLALSGGAVRGAAQAGALSVLDEHGIPIHVIAGTSAGSTVGALYASGMEAGTISEFIGSFSWTAATKPSLHNRLGLFSMRPFAAAVTEHLTGPTFADLDKKLIVVACDILTGSRVLISEGDIATAIQGSSAVPGLFVPIEHEDRLLIDGGTVDNYPTTVPLMFGADVVIGIDIGSNPGEHAPTTLIEMLIAAAAVRGKSTGVRIVDVDIVPDVREFSSFDFDHIPEMFDRGRTAAIEAIPQIEAMLADWGQ